MPLGSSVPERELSEPRVGVVVVSYNPGPHLARCLEAVGGQTLAPQRVIVVDNGSADGGLAGLGGLAGEREIVALGRNTGFAAGANRGVERAADCDWVALLNPDAFPEPGWLEALVRHARERPEVALLASRQLIADDPSRLDGAGDVYAVSGLAWRRFFGRPAGEASSPEEVFSPCAAAALYRRDALVDAFGFDESFFCYFEDVDLAFRMRLRGHRCLYVPDAVVHHVGSAVSGRHSAFSLYHGHRNLVWTWWKNMPGPLVAAYLPHHVALTAVSLVHFAARGLFRPVFRAKRDALRGLPAVLAQRRRTQATRVATARDLRRVMVGGWTALGVGRHLEGAAPAGRPSTSPRQ
jgi:GT2 family glycosyltransferase